MNYEDVNEVNRLFDTFIETIKLVFENKFYTNTESLYKVKDIMEKWYSSFQSTNSLTIINVKDIEFLDLEVTQFFDDYIETEPVPHNYAEILSYNLSHIIRYWKDEMEKRGNKNVR